MPNFIIESPAYSYMHSGIRCLFLLCHHLNSLGYKAHITGEGAPSWMSAPFADENIIAEHRESPDGVVIYPEIVAGNPRGFRRVVRYLLNKQRTPFAPEDFVIHYADEFRTPGLLSRRLWVPLLDQSVFHAEGAAEKRSGFLVYSVRHRPDLSSIPDWARPFTVISREEPRDPNTLAGLYRRSSALITWERTAAIGEAMFCRCPVIVIPNSGLDLDPILRRTFGLGFVVGWDRAALPRAQRTVTLATRLYRMRSLGMSRNIHRFVGQAAKHFAGLERHGRH